MKKIRHADLTNTIYWIAHGAVIKVVFQDQPVSLTEKTGHFD